MVVGNSSECVHLQLYSTAPAPCRDYYGLTVTNADVILNVWNVTHGPHVYPKRQKSTLEEFDTDRTLKDEIRRVFGEHVIDYVIGLTRKDGNIQYLPTKVFLAIIRMLANNDILHLSQTSKIFFELCSSNAVWKILFRKRAKKGPTQFEKAQSDYIPWRELLKKKVGYKPSTGKRPIRQVLNGTATVLAASENAEMNNALKNLPFKKKSKDDNILNVINDLKGGKGGKVSSKASTPKSPLSLAKLLPKSPNSSPSEKSLLSSKASSTKLDNVTKEKHDKANYSTPFMKPKLQKFSSITDAPMTDLLHSKIELISSNSSFFSAPRKSSTSLAATSQSELTKSKSKPAAITSAGKTAATKSTATTAEKPKSEVKIKPSITKNTASILEKKKSTIKSKPSIKSTTSILEKIKPAVTVNPAVSFSGSAVNITGRESGNPKPKSVFVSNKKPMLSEKQKLYMHSVV